MGEESNTLIASSLSIVILYLDIITSEMEDDMFLSLSSYWRDSE